MRKLMVGLCLIIAVAISDLGHTKGNMFVSQDGCVATTASITLDYLMLLFVQEDMPAFGKAVQIGLHSKEIVVLQKGEKVFHIMDDNQDTMKVWIRRQGDPQLYVSYGTYFK